MKIKCGCEWHEQMASYALIKVTLAITETQWRGSAYKFPSSLMSYMQIIYWKHGAYLWKNVFYIIGWIGFIAQKPLF